MNDRIVHLRIKIKSLVDESRNIRREANKTSGMAKWKLNQHRKTTVREHTRDNLLAYGEEVPDTSRLPSGSQTRKNVWW